MKRILLGLSMSLYLTSNAQYSGTGSVTQGLATVLQSDLYSCSGGRVTNTGSITATDNTMWIVPAETRFTDNSTPWASDLYNSCNGNTFANTSSALSALNTANIIDIDSTGELITAFVFADNYFEMYVNGILVGKDQVPYTPFNSSIVQFRVNRPFTIAMHLVDWEEHLGLGAELNGGFSYHDGDGGMVAILKNSNNEIITQTDHTWKAQTFYTSPIQDLNCPSEIGALRLSNNCSTADVQDGSSFYALHWQIPLDCYDQSYDDSNWPQASVYSNTEVGINNKPAYENFTDLFDSQTKDAEFIWSTNLILDNEVVVRKNVLIGTGIQEKTGVVDDFIIYPNPAHNGDILRIASKKPSTDKYEFFLYNIQKELILSYTNATNQITLSDISPGVYFINIQKSYQVQNLKLIIQ